MLVHYQMVLGSRGEVKVFGDWFKLHYVLNEGMAFGIRFGHEYAKPGLTPFRLVAVVFIAIYLFRMAWGTIPFLTKCLLLHFGHSIWQIYNIYLK